MQDLEFTIEDGQLWMLQTRNGKRTAARGRAHRRRDGEGEADRHASTPCCAWRPSSSTSCCTRRIDPKAAEDAAREGPPRVAGRRRRQGRVLRRGRRGRRRPRATRRILVRTETSPEDIHGMDAAEGILTANGGCTSHAAVVARGMGKCCVVGCDALRIDYTTDSMTVGDKTVKEGDWITLDGATGEVFLGQRADHRRPRSPATSAS